MNEEKKENSQEFKQEDEYIEIPLPGEEEITTEETKNNEKTEEKEEKAITKEKTTSKKKATKKTTSKKTTKKKATKKTKQTNQTNKPSKKTKKKSLDWIWILLIIIGLSVIAIVSYMLIKGNTEQTTTEKTMTTAVTVNGEPIYQEEIDELYEKLPESLKAQTTKEQLTEQLIEQKILIQKTKEANIKVSEKEIEEYITGITNFFRINETQLKELLEKQGLTYEEFKKNSEDQIAVNKLLNETVIQKIEIKEEEMKKYYEENKKLFTKPETATVRHILITPNDNESEEELMMRAEEIRKEIKEDFSNFCELVKEKTGDQGSKDNCGEYEVMKDGKYVKEFEEAAFEMTINETKVVKTVFGAHIIWKVSETPEKEQSYEEAKETIKEMLMQTKIPEKVKEYVDKLKEEAKIEYQNQEETTTEMKETTKENTEETTTEMKETTKETKNNEKTEENTNNNEKEFETKLADCLKEKQTKMYGVNWAPDVKAQKETLGTIIDSIEYIDCETEETNEECSEITTYPTWKIGEKTLKGKQSLNSLASASECLA